MEDSAWNGRAVEFPAGSLPSGTGFPAGDLYYVPLSSGEVFAVDIREGKIVHTYTSRRNAVPGNLVCYKGRIVSQRAGAVEVFQQLDALRRRSGKGSRRIPATRKCSPSRARFSGMRASSRRPYGSLRKAYQLAPGPNHRNLLRDALLEALQTDFAAFRGGTEEIERLLDEPKQQAVYHRLMAAGLESAGEFRPALASYLRLIELDGKQRDSTVWTSRTWSAATGGSKCGSPLFARHRRRRSARRSIAWPGRKFEAAARQGAPEALERFLDYFAGQPIAGQAWRQLAAKEKQSDHLLRAEMALRRMEAFGDRAQAATATAELAEMLRQAKLPGDASRLLRALGPGMGGGRVRRRPKGPSSDGVVAGRRSGEAIPGSAGAMA